MTAQTRVVLAASLYVACSYIPRERGNRASSSEVELFGTEQPGAAMYLAPASALAFVHCFRISAIVNFSKSISSTPPRIGWEYCIRTSEIGIPLVFTEYWMTGALKSLNR